MPRPASPPTPPPRPWRRSPSWPSAGLGFTRFSNLQGAGALTDVMMVVVLLAVPGITLLIFLQRRARFAEDGRSVFPPGREGGIVPSRDRGALCSKTRLTVSAPLHLSPGSARHRHFHRLPPGGGQINLLSMPWLWKRCSRPCAAWRRLYRRPSACRNRAMPCWPRCSASRRNRRGGVAAEAGARNVVVCRH